MNALTFYQILSLIHVLKKQLIQVNFFNMKREEASELIMSEFEHQLAYLQECEETEQPDVPNIEDLEL